jgi:DNA-binding CsgD family transcriptional regulator
VARRRAKIEDLRVSRVELAGARVAVLSLPADTDTGRFAQLTRAERDVAALLVGGLSNAEVSDARRTSEHTVANQVAAIYAKLGVSSRAGFVAVAAGRIGARDGGDDDLR